MSNPHLDKLFEKLGRSCRAAKAGNLIVGSFAAELVGESYPFSKAMCDIVFKSYTDHELGKRFADWTRDHERHRSQ